MDKDEYLARIHEYIHKEWTKIQKQKGVGMDNYTRKVVDRLTLRDNETNSL